MSERELVHQFERRTEKNRNLAEGLQRTTPTQFVELLAARGVCTDCNGDAGMRKAKLVQGCQSWGLKRRPLLRTSSPLNPIITRELTLRLVQQTGALHIPGHASYSHRTTNVYLHSVFSF